MSFLNNEKESGKIKITDVKILRNTTDQYITKCINNAITSFKGDIVGTKFPPYLKRQLEKKYGFGWNVFSGKHFSGSCTFVENHFAELEINGTIVVIFKSFIPEDE